MNVTAIKTPPVKADQMTLEQLVDAHATSIRTNTILAVTSKVVSLCGGDVVKIGSEPKSELVYREADYYLPPGFSQYDANLTIKSNIMIAAAGIDESNGDGYHILWPKDPQLSANRLREHLQ